MDEIYYLIISDGIKTRKYKKKASVINTVIRPNINIIIAKPIELVIDFCNDF
jgi:hypothetical protein